MSVRAHAAGIVLAGAAILAAVTVAAGQDLPPQITKLLKADSECIDRNASHLTVMRETAQLTDNHTLYLVPCFTGAYNVVYRVYVLDKRYPDEVRPSAFAGYSDGIGWYGKIQLINAEYDEKTKTLRAFEKGRGLGDCGSAPSYRWTEFGWRMLEYRYWGKCDGSRMPGDWPVIYRHKPQ